MICSNMDCFQGPGRIHEIIIQKPVEVRGFGFKLDDGQAEKRTVFISSVEDGKTPLSLSFFICSFVFQAVLLIKLDYVSMMKLSR